MVEGLWSIQSVTAVISVLGALFSFWNTQRFRRLNLLISRLDEERRWAATAVASISKALTFVRERGRISESEWNDRILEVLVELATALDRGRLFHPNTPVKGTRRGWRADALDPLRDAYREMTAGNPSIERLEDIRHAFVQIEGGYLQSDRHRADYGGRKTKPGSGTVLKQA